MAENPAAFDVLKLSVAIQYLLLLSTKNQEETVRSKSRKIRFQPGRLNSVQRSGALLPSKPSKREQRRSEQTLFWPQYVPLIYIPSPIGPGGNVLLWLQRSFRLLFN